MHYEVIINNLRDVLNEKKLLNYGAKSCMGGSRPTFPTQALDIVMKGGPTPMEIDVAHH